MTPGLSYSAALPAGATGVLIPGGMETPHGRSLLTAASNWTPVRETATGQTAYWWPGPTGALDLTFRFEDASGTYPEAMFHPHPSPYSRYAEDLVAEVRACTGGLTGLDCARAIACHAAERFTYGHPEAKFAEGLDEIPALGCGLTEGSCVDINTYFIAALRLSGIEAGYVTGYYFPKEKGGTCEDGHCWVATRIGGETQEWDIAHHLKMGTREIHPGLNPKPGHRVATFHSMGLRFPLVGPDAFKALIEPLVLVGDRFETFKEPDIRLHVPAVA